MKVLHLEDYSALHSAAVVFYGSGSAGSTSGIFDGSLFESKLFIAILVFLDEVVKKRLMVGGFLHAGRRARTTTRHVSTQAICIKWTWSLAGRYCTHTCPRPPEEGHSVSGREQPSSAS